VDLEEIRRLAGRGQGDVHPYDEALGVHPQDEGFTGARTERGPSQIRV
jgi:hypothetical protein